jgi:hypothetical protein
MTEPSAVSANEPAAKRSQRALVTYPYFDLENSLDVARKIHENAGGSCTPDQLAVYLKYKSTTSGTFQTRLSAAKQFGFVRQDGTTISVTDRAMQIISPVMPEDAIRARADAFMEVGLFARVYEKYFGTTIPPKVGMKNLLLTTFGVSIDRVDPAVRVLFDSATQAGFFPQNDQSRLVRPTAKPGQGNAQAEEPQAREPAVPKAGGGGGGGDGPTGVHPAIVGLLRELPAAGSPWPKKSKDRFVKAFLASLEFVYPDDSEEDLA